MMNYEEEEAEDHGNEDEEKEQDLAEELEEEVPTEKSRLRHNSDGDSLNDVHNENYEDVAFDEEEAGKRNGNHIAQFDRDEESLGDPVPSSFFSATYPMIIEYKSTYQKLKEGVVQNQNKFFLAMVIAITVFGLIGVLIYFSAKTYAVEEEDPLIINTAEGKIRGFNATQARKYLGIPYAAPPTGDLRWKPPRPHPSWTGIRNATAPGASCLQDYNILCPIEDISEDCLFLNVYTPLNATLESNLPVLVWIHGGAFGIGSGIQYDGEHLASHNIIVVTINYRLGPLGYLGLEELRAEDPQHPTSGLYGLLDQRAALSWVQRNIGYFGGNPEEVTLAGQSAGGMSVCFHLTSPGSAGLFNKAILQSGPCYLSTWNRTANMSREFVRRMGCDGLGGAEKLACMRSKPANLTVSLAADAYWMPAPDSVELSEQPMDLMERGKFHRMAGILLGSTKDEDSFWLCREYKDITVPQYEELVRRLYPTAQANQILSLYQGAAYEDGVSALVDAFSDRDFKCPARMAAQYFSREAKTYMYSYENEADFIYVFDICFKSTHASELPMLFPTTLKSCGWDFPAISLLEEPLASYMAASWTSFVKYTDPNKRDDQQQIRQQGRSRRRDNNEEGVKWMLFTNETKPYIILNRQRSDGTDYRGRTCPFWDTNDIAPAFDFLPSKKRHYLFV